jgi:ATP-dependent Clp protease ATP-binding subunit ClpA
MTTDHCGGFTVTLTGDPGEYDMFERYTDRAKRSVELAQLAAQGLCHDEVGTDHLFLGLLGEGGGVAFRALGALGVTVEAANEAVCRRHPAGDRVTSGWLPWTPRFRKVQELALRASIELGHNFIATEHLLLGLVREGSDIGALALADCGMDAEIEFTLDDVQAKVLELLRGYDDAERRKAGYAEEAPAAAPVVRAGDGPVVAELFASWAQRRGILARVTESQCADLAQAFAYGYACGAGSAAAHAAAAKAREWAEAKEGM